MNNTDRADRLATDVQANVKADGRALSYHVHDLAAAVIMLASEVRALRCEAEARL